ncbi:LemA family protein [Porphyromonadaceae bacterium W3.11]|nr:LemA family protein [Porphyromonadaceae bacterium W3.11]
MKKRTVGILVILVLLLSIVGYGAAVYNKLVKNEENVNAAWSQVSNQYERRSDLIPNLVNTVKGYAEHEQETLTKVVEARSKATQIQVNPENINAEGIQEYLAAQDELSQALSRLMVTVEAYPDLKASDSFLMLQSQLEGTENRISVERKRFIEQVKNYNSYSRKFPNNLFVKLLGFDVKEYFTASEGADKAVEVAF